MVDLILKRCSAPIHLDRVYETDMAEGLKAMALEGHGVAFLPISAVRKEVRAHKLVSAVPPDLKDLSITMEIRAYRERPVHKDSHKPASHHGQNAEVKSHAHSLWNYLVANV
jgi:DNA-binding transcriptional LysR family regulator